MNNFQRDFKNAYDEYYNAKPNARIPYAEFANRAEEATLAYATEILDSESREDIQKAWFKNYGTMNGWNWEQSFNFRVANILHQWDMDRNPQFHDVDEINTMRGWHETKCKCGFEWSCDSSD